MTTEQKVNKDFGSCTYKEISRSGTTILWERACGDNNIDFVIGYKYSSSKPPTFKNFDIQREKDICLRYVERGEAEAFFNLKY